MFQKLTYKRIIKFLPIGFIIVLMLVYGLAIHETLSLKRKCKELTEQTIAAEDAPKQIVLLKNKLDDLNKVMGKDTTDAESDPLLRFVAGSNTNNNVRLVDFQPLHVFQHQNYQVETRVAVFAGQFVNLVRFLYSLERDFNSGKVVSVKFQVETNYKTNRKRLLMTLYVQSVKNGMINTEGSLPQTK
jgi:preprotein translocase subunit SecF